MVNHLPIWVQPPRHPKPAQAMPNESLLPAIAATVLLATHLPAAEPRPFVAELKPEILEYEPFTWPGEIPEGCPFERSAASMPSAFSA
jgi:hypothetical protein